MQFAATTSCTVLNASGITGKLYVKKRGGMLSPVRVKKGVSVACEALNTDHGIQKAPRELLGVPLNVGGVNMEMIN